MIPDHRIIENIKKLKDLGMSKEDIKNNLLKMNLSSKDCDELMAAADNEIISEEKTKTREKKTKAPKREEEIPEEIEEQELKEVTDETKKELPEKLFDKDSNLEMQTEEETDFVTKEKNVEIPDITKGLDIDKLNLS